jgi:hypothetical protein
MGLQILRVVYPLGGVLPSFTDQKVTLEGLVRAVLEGILRESFGEIAGIRPDGEARLGMN